MFGNPITNGGPQYGNDFGDDVIDPSQIHTSISAADTKPERPRVEAEKVRIWREQNTKLIVDKGARCSLFLMLTICNHNDIKSFRLTFNQHYMLNNIFLNSFFNQVVFLFFLVKKIMYLEVGKLWPAKASNK